MCAVDGTAMGALILAGGDTAALDRVPTLSLPFFMWCADVERAARDERASVLTDAGSVGPASVRAPSHRGSGGWPDRRGQLAVQSKVGCSVLGPGFAGSSPANSGPNR